jgi:hypothetical protein
MGGWKLTRLSQKREIQGKVKRQVPILNRGCRRNRERGRYRGRKGRRGGEAKGVSVGAEA